MLKFIQNLFGVKPSAPTAPVAPYKIEPPAVSEKVDTPQVNAVNPVVNSRKAPTAKPKAPVATGNTPAKKKVAAPAKKPQPKK